MLLARTVLAMLFALAIGLLLQLLGGVHLALPQCALLLLIDVLGTLLFCAIGLYLGARVGGSGAPALVNLIYLPMAFLSGLWIPLQMLPSLLTTLAPLWPSYHLGQLALRVVGQDNGGSSVGHVAALLAVTVAFFALAYRRLRRALMAGPHRAPTALVPAASPRGFPARSLCYAAWPCVLPWSLP